MRASLALSLLLAACNAGLLHRIDAGQPDLDIPDLSTVGCTKSNACGDCDPTCIALDKSAPLPLQSDAKPDPLEADTNLARAGDGSLVLSACDTPSHFAWTANSDGTVSKLDTTAMREVARYPSVTCFSNSTGSTDQCDGTNGCCTAADYYRYQATMNQQALPKHQAVQVTNNVPNEIAVDPAGGVWVGNQGAGIPSVTHIALDPSDCVDRNKNGHIDTSLDADMNGIIEIDCNHDGLPDDLVDVKVHPCLNGKQEEYFGENDECVLTTTNIGVNTDSIGGIAVAPSVSASPAGDLWVTSIMDGLAYRIDGVTGKGPRRNKLTA